MKRVAIAIFLATMIIAGIFPVCAQTSIADSIIHVYDSLNPDQVKSRNEAVLYYNNLTVQMPELKKTIFQYKRAMTQLRNAKTVDKKRQEVLKSLARMKDSCVLRKPFLGDSTLKSGIIAYLDLVVIILKNDFGKILDMEDIKEQSYDADEAHQLAIDLALEKLNGTIDLLNKVEYDYFKKYHITVNKEKDEMTLKIERANNAIEYYNRVQRLYYKSNKEYFYARQSAGSKDVVGLEQHTGALLCFVQDGLEKLKRQTPYEGDSGLLASATDLLHFYLIEAQKILPANVDFNLKTDNLQKADKKFKAIKAGDRKKEEVDEINAAVNQYNDAVKGLNSMNDASYKKHKQLLDTWEKQKEKFFQKHS